MPPPPALMEEEHVEEILLRFPPRQPASLFRAALVCKRWCRLISSAAFRRRYREFHRTPPMLAFLSNGVHDPDGPHFSNFVPTAAFCSLPGSAKTGYDRTCRPLDARHGRILYQHVEDDKDARHGDRFLRGKGVASRLAFPSFGVPAEGARGLFVSVPIAKELRRVPIAPIPSRGLRTLAAAVVCADTTGACDHLDCHRRPFLVVFVGYDSDARKSFIYTYSSESATWSDKIPALRAIKPSRFMPSAYVGNALYFGFRGLKSILKYDLQLRKISWIQLPAVCSTYHPNVLTTTEAGVLGLATIREYKLYTWFRKDDAPGVGDAGWTQTKTIDLRGGLPVSALLGFREPQVLGFADGIGLIFFCTSGVIYTFHLKTGVVKKLCDSRTIYAIVPYMSFYTPALGAACTGEGPSAGGSSA